jgi:ribosome-associated protein
VNLESLPQGVRLAIEAAQSKKAGGITVLNLSGHAAFTEYFVICTGHSTPQLQAICNEVEEVLYREMKRTPEHREGHRSAEWALLDFGGFIVHVFGEQARRYYDLERLWRAAPSLVLPDEPDSPERRHSAPDENYLQP